jgi:hypothetical protein
MSTAPTRPADPDPPVDPDPSPDLEETTIADRMPPWFYGAVVFVVAAIVAGAFAFVVIKVVEYADNPSEVIWGRRLYLYEGLFSLISAVVGAVFATTVFRPQLRKARTDAGRAQRTAQSNAREAGAAREHGRVRAEQTRARILEHVGRRSARRPATFRLGPEMADRPDLARNVIESALDADESVYFSRGPEDVPEPQLTLADVVEAVEASRVEEETLGR